jgi:predicted double-glycine peptidase
MPIKYWKIPKGAVLVPVPDVTQDERTTCGASALLAVCLYYGVGPVEEWEVAEAMKMRMRSGANPQDVIRGAKRFGLQVHQEKKMTVGRLRYHLRRGRPVMVMLQAWGDKSNYSDEWYEGHWVVAIGWDERGFYFEDPSIGEARGHLTYEELKERWHDIGRFQKHTPNYGVALWKSRTRTNAKDVVRARRIT